MNIPDYLIIIAGTTILNLVITYLLIRIILIKLNLNHFIRMGKQFASINGFKSQKVQHQRAAVAMNTNTKKKIADAAISELPLGGLLQRIIEKAGISPNEIFGLIQDENFMKGVMVIMNLFGGVVGKVTGKDEKGKQTTPSNEVPQE